MSLLPLPGIFDLVHRPRLMLRSCQFLFQRQGFGMLVITDAIFLFLGRLQVSSSRPALPPDDSDKSPDPVNQSATTVRNMIGRSAIITRLDSATSRNSLKFSPSLREILTHRYYQWDTSHRAHHPCDTGIKDISGVFKIDMMNFAELNQNEQFDHGITPDRPQCVIKRFDFDDFINL